MNWWVIAFFSGLFIVLFVEPWLERRFRNRSIALAALNWAQRQLDKVGKRTDEERHG